MDETINLNKNNIRQTMGQMRRSLTILEIEERSAIALKKLEMLDVFKEAKVVMAYWSIKDELATHSFIAQWTDSKNIVLPCIEGERLFVRKFTGESAMQSHPRFGIPEPVGEIWLSENIDLVIVPGLAFDRNNHRLGYGKGFYDRFLAKLQVFKVGVCFDFQMVDELPINEFDIAVDVVVTD